MPDLGVCYAQPFWYDGETHTTNDTSIIFPLSVGRDHFDDIHLFVPLERTDGEGGPLALGLGTEASLVPGLDPDRVIFHPLPFYTRTRDWYRVGALPEALATVQVLRAGLPACDLVWMPGPPHVPTMICYALCRRLNLDAFLYLRSDQEREIEAQNFSGYLSAKRWLGAQILPRIERHIVEHVPTVVAGPSLREKYNDITTSIHTVRSIHLSERHLIETPEPAIERNAGTGILYVGRLVPVKGVSDLIDAVECLVARGTDVSLDVVGTGKQERELRRLAEESTAGDRITFHGFVPFGPALFEQYRAADAFVLPSYSEGFPNVVLEAMAQGTPVITTDAGGIDQLIADGENGLVVPSRDPAAIASAIETLADEPATRARLIRNGLRTAEEYTVERQESKLREILASEFPRLGFRSPRSDE